MQPALQVLIEASGEVTSEVRDELLELGLTDEQIEILTHMQGRFPGGGNERGLLNAMPERDANAPGGMDRPNMNNTIGVVMSTDSHTSYAALIVVLLMILAGATAFVAKSKAR